MNKNLVIVRGGGDVATGTIQKLKRVGFDVLVLEIERPTCIRGNVAVAQAIFEGEIQIEDIEAIYCKDRSQIEKAFAEDKIAVTIDPKGRFIEEMEPICVIDGILAKKNLGTKKDMAPITIGLGPGFIAGEDVDLVIETNRGHDLGRLIFEGPAAPNTGNPGNINGFTTERILRSTGDGRLHILKDLGSVVKKGEAVATVSGEEIYAGLDGMIRGMINEGSQVTKGMKVGDVDPRVIPRNVGTISDKARLIGGGSLEGLLIMKRRKGL